MSETGEDTIPIPTENIQYIEEHQQPLAEMLVKSFYFSRGLYPPQIEYLEDAQVRTGINIFELPPSELMANEHIKTTLVSAFLIKHKGKKRFKRRNTNEATILSELETLWAKAKKERDQ